MAVDNSTLLGIGLVAAVGAAVYMFTREKPAAASTAKPGSTAVVVSPVAGKKKALSADDHTSPEARARDLEELSQATARANAELAKQGVKGVGVIHIGRMSSDRLGCY